MKGMVCMANTKKTNSNSIKSTKSKNTNLNVNKVELKEVEGAKHIFSQKNILIIVCIVLALILVIFYGYRVNKLKETDTLSKSYLLDSGTVSLEIKNLDEVNQILAESPTEYFVLISYTGNKDTYKLENGLKRILDKYKLNFSASTTVIDFSTSAIFFKSLSSNAFFISLNLATPVGSTNNLSTLQFSTTSKIDSLKSPIT